MKELGSEEVQEEKQVVEQVVEQKLVLVVVKEVVVVAQHKLKFIMLVVHCLILTLLVEVLEVLQTMEEHQ